MAEYAPPILKSRREQMMFPLTKAEIERVRRFGEVRRFAPGNDPTRCGGPERPRRLHSGRD